MMSYLRLTIRFLMPYYHGRADGAEPEWPPSPLRLFQALTAAASQRWRDEQHQDRAFTALRWLERQPTPIIAAANGRRAGTKYRLYIPDNTADIAAGTWTRGDTTRIIKRAEKDVRPVHVPDLGEVHYCFSLVGDTCPHLEVISSTAQSITHLGWGVDMVSGNADVITEGEVAGLKGAIWRPSSNEEGGLRTFVDGTLNALVAKHKAFLNRISSDARGNESFNPVPPLSKFRVVGYRRTTDPAPRHAVVFELRQNDDAYFSYAQEKLIHLAGMTRHLAIAAMQKSPPDGVADDWVETYVAGHAKPDAVDHRQFSYVPLPSIGHAHSDQRVRRVMITAPTGDGQLLEYLAARLAGHQLRPTPKTRLHDPPVCGEGLALNEPPTLVRNDRDAVARLYTRSATNWASVTPVILPGHDDHKPDKTRKLIERALVQSGVDQPCEFEWSAYSRFPKSLSAHKYDRQKRDIGYIRPEHLLNLTAVHLQLRFNDELRMPGPLAIGAGRHCGLGLMAGTDSM